MEDLTDLEREGVAQGSYGYWNACRKAEITYRDEMRDVMALREIARYFDAAKEDRPLTFGALQRTCEFRKHYRMDLLRSCFDETLPIYANEKDKKIAQRYRSLISDEMKAQSMFVKAGRTGRGVLVLGSRICKETLEEAFVMTVMYMIERAIAVTESLSRGKEQKIDVIIDVSHFKPKCAPRKSTLKAVFHILQEHYPERLRTLVVLEPPLWVSTLFAIVSKFLDQRTRNKVQLARGKSKQAVLGDILMYPHHFEVKDAATSAVLTSFQDTVDVHQQVLAPQKEEFSLTEIEGGDHQYAEQITASA